MMAMMDFIVKYWLEALFGVVLAALSVGYKTLANRLKSEKKKNQAIEDGLRDLLRIQILDNYERCVAAGNTITVSRKDAIDSAYQSYHALGGNGTITRVHQEIMEMRIV